VARQPDGRDPADRRGAALSDSSAAIAEVFREEAGRITGALVRLLGDFALAEETVQDAIVMALERWPVEGVPDRPGAWLVTVAKHRALDVLRRQGRFREKLAEVDWNTAQEPDDRLRLLFTCCHPALACEAQVALTLRAVCGLTAAQIARAFLTSEATVAKRIVRARRKIVEAGIPYRIPRPEDLDGHLSQVLNVLYLTFNEGYLASDGDAAERRDLAEDAAWLTGMLASLLPGQAEVLGLQALMRLHLARAGARFDASGEIVLLRDQDRTRWDRRQIAAGLALLKQAAALHKPGPYQIQAAIVACHAGAASWEATDWPQVVALYDLLDRLAPSPIVRLNRAIALAQLAGPAAGLSELEPLAEALQGYAPYHAARALALTGNPAEQTLLCRRLILIQP
jgi:RNA polymerase sigma factor (sigma-70 family)